MPRRPPPPVPCDTTSFRSYLVSRRQYSGEAIELRLMLRTAPAELLTAPQLLAWMASSGQPPHLIAHVARARSLYADARRAAERRAKALLPF